MDSFNPNLFTNDNDSYRIFLDGTSKPSRGKFEYAFSRIGCSFLTGGAIGWAIGSYNGIKFLQNEMGNKTGLAHGLQDLSWKVKRSHMLNHIVKTGTNTANTFGIIAFTYSALNTVLSLTTEIDDKFNTLFSATSTGLIYRYASTPKYSKHRNLTLEECSQSTNRFKMICFHAVRLQSDLVAIN